MRRPRHVWRLLVGALALVAVLAVVAAWWIAARVSSPNAQRELEARLSEALSTHVTIGKLDISPWSWGRLEARELRAWPAADGFGLEIERALGSIDPISLLFGELRLRRVELERAVLRLAALRGSAAVVAGSALPHERSPSELLRPLIGLEVAVRYLLDSPLPARAIEVRDSRIELARVDPASNGADRAARVELREVGGRLVRHHFTGESRLELSARAAAGERDLGAIALDGGRSRSGRMRLALQLDSLALGISDAYLDDLGSEARIDGSLSGEIRYETPEPGSGHLEIDLVCAPLRSFVPAVGGAPPERTELPRVDLDASLVITPDSIAVHQGVIAAPKTQLRIRGSVARPLERASLADLSLEFDDVAVAQIRHLIGWLPEVEREEAAAVVERIVSGRLVSLRASGTASLESWQDFLAGRARTQPQDFRLRAELADAVVAVGERDRIEALKGRVEWVGKRAKVVGATARLNGEPLPRLDLVIEGFPNIFAGDRAARELASGGGSLAGLGTLWRSLRPEGEPAPSEAPTSIEFHLDYLDHPMFLWPIRDLDFAIESGERGVRVERLRGRWAGVPIDGSAEWLFLPDEQVRVSVSAGQPGEARSEPIPPERWARGRFAVGRIEREVWRQSAARAEFAAAGDRVRIRDLAIDLEPTGAVEANGRVDLSQRDAVPFQLSFDLAAGDAAMIAELFGLSSQQIHGVVDLVGSFEGELRPETSIYASLRGLLQVSARDGVIRKKAPPVAAVSRATEAIEDFDPREIIEYRRVETLLEFSDGKVHTEEFTLDGPTLGVFASGEVELVSEPQNMDGKVALFLFRKLDRVLEKIPIVSQLLLGTDANLVAVYFQVKGPWDDPTVKPILLPTSAGPASVVLQGVPLFVKRGFRSLAAMMRRDAGAPESAIGDGTAAELESPTESNAAGVPDGAIEGDAAGAAGGSTDGDAAGAPGSPPPPAAGAAPQPAPGSAP